MAWETKTRTESFHSLFCSHGGPACGGWYMTGKPLPERALVHVGETCTTCGKGTYKRETGTETIEYRIQVCGRCGNDDCSDRYSMGAYYSCLCDRCWENSGVVGSDGNDRPVYYLDAGEIFDTGEPSDLF